MQQEPKMADAGIRPEARFRIRRATLIGGFTAALLIATLIAFWPRPPASATNPIDMSVKMDGCRVETLKTLGMTKVEIGTMYQVSAFCYSAIRDVSMLGEFNIRRLFLVSQQFETLVIMWMVVAITISGVILAGVQLAASYRLATLGKGDFDHKTEISVTEGRMSMTSSITGLLILTVSLAFFFVFVKFVYKLDLLQTSLGVDSSVVQPAAELHKARKLAGNATFDTASGTAPANAKSASANSAAPRAPFEAQRKQHTPRTPARNNFREQASDHPKH
jgi:hypothetical protein